MLRNEEAACFQQQDTKVALPLAVDFFGDIGAVHSGPNDNCIERKASIVDGFVVGVTDVAAQNVEGKGSFLYIDRVWSFLEIANHVVLLPAGLLGSVGIE